MTRPSPPIADVARPVLVDRFFRPITYLRVSVTDRCDLRCVYCMSEHMTFLPRKELLTIEELDRLCSAFVERGVRKLRLTGGEPLVRRGVMDLVRRLSRHLDSGELDELTLTTNGTQLARFAGDLDRTLGGIYAAQAAGLTVKINAVALKGVNENELGELICWAHRRAMDITLIETMPLGETGEDRTSQYLPLSMVRSRLQNSLTLTDILDATGGPARYVRVEETGGRLGFITPLTHNFCESCNRVRVTCTGTLFLCLGQERSVDLRRPLRQSAQDGPLNEAINRGLEIKPRGHDFVIDRRNAAPTVSRHMSVTGG